LSPDALRDLAHEIFSLTSVSATRLAIDHRALATLRVAKGEARLNTSGDTLFLDITSRLGQRQPIALRINQVDHASLRQIIEYIERIARHEFGDPIDTAMPIPPRSYVPNRAWHASTMSAFFDGRHGVVERLVAPVNAAGLITSAFVGVTVKSMLRADKHGIFVTGQETDSEITVTAWNANRQGSGWAGQAARDWTMQRPDAIAHRAIEITKLAANPVAFEPGRYTVILDRPAVAQIVSQMGGDLWALPPIEQHTGVMYDRNIKRARFGQRVVDARITLSSDPNDPEGGYIPFNYRGDPLVPMTWVENGVLKNLAYDTFVALRHGVSPANDPPASLRMSGGPTTVEEMIASCPFGIYVNRLSQVTGVEGQQEALLTGVTNGGCFLVRNGKIVKSIRDLRFVESPWLAFNRIEAIGTSERTALGYGNWPGPPTIVPPLMIREFNFTALKDVW